MKTEVFSLDYTPIPPQESVGQLDLFVHRRCIGPVFLYYTAGGLGLAYILTNQTLSTGFLDS